MPTRFVVTRLSHLFLGIRESQNPSAAFVIRRRLQKTLCYFAMDHALEMHMVQATIYEPPGLVPAGAISIDSERFACPDILFQTLQPSAAGMYSATDAVINS
jgi:hypothetical protein